MKCLRDYMVSIVAPVYNEAANVFEFYGRITQVLMGCVNEWEIIFINDGSRDNSLVLLEELNKRDSHVKVLNLTRNFGKENALTAGLDFSIGDVIIPIDTDLQDPPELIPQLLSKFDEGFDVVHAVRRIRSGETLFKRLTASYFYKLMNKLSRFEIPKDTGDFRLMSRRVVDSLTTLRERRRFMKGLFAWVGYNSATVYYDRDQRFKGTTTFNATQLLSLALEGITSFSQVPLQIATLSGVIISVVTVFYAIFIVIKTVLFGSSVPGYPSLMVAILFIGGVQLITIGLLGEYIGRIYEESKGRPIYLVERTVGFNTPQRNDEDVIHLTAKEIRSH